MTKVLRSPSSVHHSNVYYIVFTPAENWLKRFLHPQMGHMFVAIIKNAEVIEVDGEFRRLDVRVSKCTAEFLEQHCRNNNVNVIKVTMKEDYKPSYFWGIMLSNKCIQLVYYFTGLRFWCFTPYQLYKKLIKLRYSPAKAKYGIFSIEPIKVRY
jgi:hypothetical protein